MHTLAVVGDTDVAAEVTQSLDEHGISVYIYDIDHCDKATIQSLKLGEIPILIITVEEDCCVYLFGSATNVFVVDVPLFTMDQYSSCKELPATSEGHLTFYVDNNNRLSMASVIKQLLEQGISLTTDPNPSSPNCPSSPASYPSQSISLVSDNCSTNTVVPNPWLMILSTSLNWTPLPWLNIMWII